MRGLVMPAVPPATATAATTASDTATPTASGATASGSPVPSAPADTSVATSAPPATSKPAGLGVPATTTASSVQNADFRALAATTAAETSAAKTSAAKTTAVPTSAPASSGAATSAAAGSATASATASAAPVKLVADPLKNIGFTVPTTEVGFDALTSAQQSTLSTAVSTFNCSSYPDVPTSYTLACDGTGYRYLLGTTIVKGTQITGASAVAPDVSGGGGSSEWTVSVNMNGTAQSKWANYTSANHSTASGSYPYTCSAATVPCADYVGFILDGTIITAPQTNSTINGSTSISGSFTQKSAGELANQLKYGALPITFRSDNAQTISATLGTSQLKAGLLAGGIGLILVVLYSLLYYRGLGIVTIASLLVSGGLTYASLVILGREMGYTLSLAGIAGFIVAIGITADSFVVFFERLKDEVHEGRSIRVAVPRAWIRARRTILSADTVSFLAAAVLYYFAAGDVRGFAFTLGLSTILDLVVVFLFTHPLISLLSRSRTFGSPRFTGLNSVREYGAFATVVEPSRRTSNDGKRTARGGTAPLTGGIALLEEEDLNETAARGESVTAKAEPSEPEIRALPKRSVGAKRATPEAVSQDAAERAAARRGRTARPAPVTAQEPESDVDEVEQADGLDQPVAEAQAEVEVASAREAMPEPEPAPEAEPVPEPAPEAVAASAPAPEPAGASAAEPALEPNAPTTSAAPTTAAERAAARRARLKSKVAQESTVTDSEDES
jgi:preprotein translocase subunit SecD